MSEKIKVFDDSLSVGSGWSNLKEATGGWTCGIIITGHGIVSAYAQGDKNSLYVTRLDFVFKGRFYMRTFNDKKYSHRGIATKAKQFAREIATD